MEEEEDLAMKEDILILLKPRFLPCVYVKALESERSQVRLFGKTIEV
jgi:hypothetical protein